MTNALKPYEKRHEYTVEGEEFEKGFEELIIDLSLKAYTDHTIYIDTENDDICAVPSCNYISAYSTYYGINKKLFDWKLDGTRPIAVYTFDYSELEECASEDEVKELRRQFEERFYDEDYYEDKEEFYDDYAISYVEFLLDAENENIDKCVRDYIKDTVDYYKEIFDEKYYELLKDEEDELVED